MYTLKRASVSSQFFFFFFLQLTSSRVLTFHESLYILGQCQKYFNFHFLYHKSRKKYLIQAIYLEYLHCQFSKALAIVKIWNRFDNMARPSVFEVSQLRRRYQQVIQDMRQSLFNRLFATLPQPSPSSHVNFSSITAN